MSEAGTQEVEVTVEGTITRLMPCPLHAGRATGRVETTHGSFEAGSELPNHVKVLSNPNGYHHGCPLCSKTPPTQEALERTVTRHVF